MKRAFIFSIIFLILINMVSASIVCSPTSITESYNQNDNVDNQIITCANTDVNNSVTMNKIGNYFSIPSTIFSPAEANKQITISFDNSAPLGNHAGVLWFTDGSTSIPIDIEVTQNNACGISIFPITLTNIKVQQGETKTRNIQLTVPSCFTSNVNVQGVALSSDEKPIQLGELSIGTLSPGQSIIIPIELDAISVSTGTYSDNLQLLLYDTNGLQINVPTVSISVLVSAGIQPISNFSLSDLPTCSLDAIEMSLNSTHKLTCTINNPNIDIKPVIDTRYIKGIGVFETGSQYIYEFSPKEIGNTIILAEFIYKQASLGIPFEQEIKISPSGNTQVSGTKLKFDFYQNSQKVLENNLRQGEIKVLMIDNSTDSVIPSFTLYLNGDLINNTFSIEANKSYELRASAFSYVDAVTQINVSSEVIEITVTPSKVSYEAGETINITTNINASLLLNDVIITSPYILSQSGELVLKAVKEGYDTKEMNISVRSRISYSAMDPNYDSWRKGKDVLIYLTENTTWSVEFEKIEDEIYKSPVILTNGNDDTVEFEIKELGRYSVKSNDFTIISKEVEMVFVVYNPLTWAWWGWVIVVVVLFGLALLFGIIGGSKDDDDLLPQQRMAE